MSLARKEYCDFQKMAPDAYETVLALGGFAAKAGIEKPLDQELIYLTSAIASINTWNRFGVAYRWTLPARQRRVSAAAS